MNHRVWTGIGALLFATALGATAPGCAETRGDDGEMEERESGAPAPEVPVEEGAAALTDAPSRSSGTMSTCAARMPATAAELAEQIVTGAHLVRVAGKATEGRRTLRSPVPGGTLETSATLLAAGKDPGVDPEGRRAAVRPGAVVVVPDPGTGVYETDSGQTFRADHAPWSLTAPAHRGEAAWVLAVERGGEWTAFAAFQGTHDSVTLGGSPVTLSAIQAEVSRLRAARRPNGQ